MSMSTSILDQFEFATELVSVGPRWYNLGFFLGVNTPELDAIENLHESEGVQRCLMELFKCFQALSKPVSWADIAEALTMIHSNHLADRIRDKYVWTVSLSLPSEKQSEQEDEVMKTGRVREIHVNKHIYIDKTIINEFNKISTSFTSLVLTIKQTLQRKSVSIDDLQEVLQDQCKLEPLSTEVATFQKVFARVHQHYCFLNYSILTHLVDRFLSNEKPLQKLLENYTNKLEKFKESMMMKDLMKLIKEKRDLCGNHKIIELKTRDFWGSVKLNKFEKLAMLVFQNLYDCAAQIRIEDGCICVSWVIPDIDTSVLDTVSPDLLKVVGVISLKIDDKVLYEEPNEEFGVLESTFLQTQNDLLLEPGCSDQAPYPTLQQFTAELDFISHRWNDLGILFGISTSDLAHIEQSHENKGFQRCLIELFKCLQSHSEPVSWNNIADALIKMYNNDLANHEHPNVQPTSVLSSLSASLKKAKKQVVINGETHLLKHLST